MSKYDPLWTHVAESGCSPLVLTFSKINEVLGFTLDHSFLTFKKELTQYGWVVGKVSMKNETVEFSRLK